MKNSTKKETSFRRAGQTNEVSTKEKDKPFHSDYSTNRSVCQYMERRNHRCVSTCAEDDEIPTYICFQCEKAILVGETAYKFDHIVLCAPCVDAAMIEVW